AAGGQTGGERAAGDEATGERAAGERAASEEATGQRAGGEQTGAGHAAQARVGIQLYTVRAELNRDFAGTLRALRDIGYRELEFVGLFDQDLKTVRGLLDQYQLSAPSAHIFPKAAQDLMREMALGHLPEEVAWGKIDAVMQIDHLRAMV